MADITSEPAAGFISESVADLPWNQHSVRSKRGGEMTGPNPADHGKAADRIHPL